MAKKEGPDRPQRGYCLTAFWLFFIAFAFAAVGRQEQTGDNSAGLGACGFAVAGGLALVAAAIVRRSNRH